MSENLLDNKCPMRATLKVIGGKWKPLILQQVNGKVSRFSELQRQIPEITKQMLTKSLRELEEDQILQRKVYPVVPPKVEYSLTERGKSLIPILEVMASWGAEQILST
ncbi:helix-turn-helix domain-containing protein [Rapidithrix thailandica]|uniref:Helix-turn-helix domain-containing protein n=1 Tax=Rapidithrix thailandica TaxID=413964 RepID=A0AAW9S3L3_9BACT